MPPTACGCAWRCSAHPPRRRGERVLLFHRPHRICREIRPRRGRAAGARLCLSVEPRLARTGACRTARSTIPARAMCGSFSDYQLDVAATARCGRGAGTDRALKYLLAHSMGGGIGLRALHRELPVRRWPFPARCGASPCPPCTGHVARLQWRRSAIPPDSGIELFVPSTKPVTYVIWMRNSRTTR